MKPTATSGRRRLVAAAFVVVAAVIGLDATAQKSQGPPNAPLGFLRNPTQGGQGFRRKADSIPMIADSR